jgi:hypothetical protein
MFIVSEKGGLESDKGTQSGIFSASMHFWVPYIKDTMLIMRDFTLSGWRKI